MSSELTQGDGFGPIKGSERIDVMDALRGFALIGIFLMNIEWFSRPFQEFTTGLPQGLGMLDSMASVGVYVLVQGKFWVLFSLLFGMGFAVMADRAKASGRNFFGPYLRRTIMLMVFGLAHIWLMWIGDILHAYALAAIVALIFYAVRGSALWIVGGGAYLGIFGLLWLLGFAMQWMPEEAMREAGAEMAKQVQQGDAAAVVYSTGSFAEISALRITEFFSLVAGNLFVLVPVAGGVFLIGMWFVRSGVLANSKDHLPLFRKLALVFLPLGALAMAGSLSYGLSFDMSTDLFKMLQSMSSFAIANLFLAIAYLSLFVLAFHSALGNRIGRILAPAGRMALTNYLGQSLICSFLFYGYGLGWYGQVSRGDQVLLVFVIFALQVVFSHWWMARFRYGPLEWLWRAVTYLKLPAFKR